MIVVDPRTGQAVYVNGEGRMFTYAIVETEQLHVNEDETEAYTMDIDNVVVDSDGAYILNLQNTNNGNLIITSITLWTASSKDDSNVEAMIGTSLASAGTTTVTPTNCNALSGLSATGTFYVNDGSGNMTVADAGLICGRHKVSTTPTKWIKESGWIIPKNQGFSLLCTKDNTFRGYLSFYYHA